MDVSESLTAQAGLMNELVSHLLLPRLESAGLTMSTFEVLSAIRASEKGASQAAIARRMGVRPPTLSETVKVLVVRGFVNQTVSPDDSRSKHLTLTLRGHAALRKVLAEIAKAEVQMKEGISTEDLQTAIQVLKACNKTLAQITNEATIE
jgi:DNA-binding MarR family transcriptional regulator